MTFFRTSALAGAIALATLAASLTPVRADSVGLWVGPGVGIGFGGIGLGVGIGIGIGHRYHGDGYRPYAGGHCGKGAALHRAASLGVSKRHVSGVSQSRISVRGIHKGRQVKVTMYRHTDTCAVRSFAYL